MKPPSGLPSEMSRLTIIVPVLNEAGGIEAALQALQPLRARGHELIVVDGGSADATAGLAAGAADRVIDAPRGRASQMNAGAGVARGDVLLFLHADTRLPDDAGVILMEALRQSGGCWGRFDVRIGSTRPILRLVALMMNLRSRLTGICTGDQAIFVTAQAFTRVGGYPPAGADGGHCFVSAVAPLQQAGRAAGDGALPRRGAGSATACCGRSL